MGSTMTNLYRNEDVGGERAQGSWQTQGEENSVERGRLCQDFGALGPPRVVLVDD